MKLYFHVYIELYDILKIRKALVMSVYLPFTVSFNYQKYMIIREMLQQDLDFKCSFEDFVAIDDNVLWLNSSDDLCNERVLKRTQVR